MMLLSILCWFSCCFINGNSLVPFGKWDVVTNNETLYAINKLPSIASNGIFAILPMAVCYSANLNEFGDNLF